MTSTDKGSLTKFLTGGDLLFNRISYLFANSMRIFLIGVATFIASGTILIYFFVSKYEWYVFYKMFFSRFWSLVGLPNYHQDFIRPDGILVDGTTSAAIIRFVKETPELSGYSNHVILLLVLALAISIAVMVRLIKFYIRFGEEAQTDDFLRGQALVEATELAQLIKNPSPIKLANIPIPLELLPRNILAVGSMGAGKSQVIEQIIEDARNWKRKMVIYDKSGEFTQRFFRPGIDVLLNPLDARCADWSIFTDLRTITDPAMLSTFFVPENKNSTDPIWDNAARMLLEDLIIIVRNDGGSMADILNIITQFTLEELSDLLKRHNAPSCGLINPKNERGSDSVRLTLTSQPAIRFFSFFDRTDASFSVREFIRREGDACLFLVSSSTHHHVARPFISAWLEIAFAEAMSMSPTTDIRLMFLLDELASLSKLKVLDTALTEGRKYGIVSTVGLQNFSQSDEIYGEHMTKVFLANLQNKLILRTEEATSADRLADNLAKEEVEEVNQSLSFGVEASRDGATLGDKRTERHLVTGSEIMILPDMTGYLKISGAHPIAKVSYEYKKRPDIVAAYIEREGLLLAAPKPVLSPEMIAESISEASSPEAPKASDSLSLW